MFSSSLIIEYGSKIDFRVHEQIFNVNTKNLTKRSNHDLKDDESVKQFVLITLIVSKTVSKFECLLLSKKIAKKMWL